MSGVLLGEVLLVGLLSGRLGWADTAPAKHMQSSCEQLVLGISLTTANKLIAIAA
jgi:hypothetical protein